VTIATGTRLVPYEIIAPIGAGGMGEVYRARDTRLDRAVAIKILPAEFAQNAQFKIRFEREAKTISRLSHPHICALYDVGENYLVMELLEGETLADRLARGPLPIAEAVQIAIHIADALDKAHRAGIIHRDLKPGNVMLTSAGVKLLDFGLAKSGGQPLSAGEATELKPLTEEGIVLGTLQYMSPEQLEGRDTDGRADIFALGAILYEMISGRRAFDGTSRASIITRILGAEPPPLISLQHLTPQSLDRIVSRCLAKQPDLRWQCAGDLKRELELLRERQVEERPAIHRSRAAIIALLLVGLIAAAEAAWMLTHRHSRIPERVVRFVVNPPADGYIKLANDVGPPALSRDGKSLVFVAVDLLSSRRSLWIRDLASVESKRLEGTEGAMFPFWSPDAKSIGFFAAGKLKRLDLAGGTPQTLCAASFGRGGTWAEDGKILFVPSPSGGIYRISSRGGVVESVTQLDKKAGEASQRWPQLLPDNRHVLAFVRRPGIASGNQTGDAIYVFDIKTGEKKFLINASSNAMYVEPGQLLYVRDRTLFSQPFDLRALTLEGEASPIVPSIQFHPAGFGMFSVSSSGVLCYQTGALISELRMVDRRGEVTTTFLEAGEYSTPVLDAAHQQVLVAVTEPGSGYQDVWQYDMVRKVARRVTFDPGDDFAPIPSPDGKRVVFASNRSGFPELFSKNIDSAEKEHRLLSTPSNGNAIFPLSWSHDGRFLAYREITGTTQMDINVFDFQTNREMPLLGSEFSETDASFSPSGRWMAYTSDESGRTQVYVTSFPTPSARWQISSGGGAQPRWRGDEKELFYMSADGNMMAVPIEARPDFKAGNAQRLFFCELRSSRVDSFEYDVSADGQQFLINSTAGHPRSLPLTIAIGWQQATP
jgi:eukaryotic-like serine/threonine-protein kinase